MQRKFPKQFADNEFVMQVLLSIYLTLALVVGLSSLFSTELATSSPFMIGEATAKGINIATRISIFYTFLVIGLLSFLIFYFAIGRFLKLFLKSISRHKELIAVIVLHIILETFNFFSDQKTQTSSLLHLTIITLVIFELIEYIFKRKFKFFKNDILNSLFLVVISLFIVTENIFITATVLLVIILLLQIKKIQKAYNGIAIVFSALPVLLFLTVESTLILNQNGFYTLGYWWIGSIILLILCTLLFLLKLNQKEISKIIYTWQAPLVVVGISIFVAYAPIFKSDNLLFEIANNLNPLMMSEMHQTTYFVDYISSHLMSDYIWMKLYSVFNGYNNNMAPVIYYGFSWICYTLTIYYFLREYFKQHFGIVIFMLFTPYLYFYFPHSYAFALIPVIFLHRYFSSHHNRFLWWFGITSTLTVFWRLDLGVATVGAAIIVFVLLFLFEKKSRPVLFKIGAVLTLFYGLLFLFYYSFCKDLIVQAIHYFGGSQGHGVSQLVKENSNLFYFDYFILPVIIGLCTLLQLFHYKTIKEKQFYWVTLFFVGFYFFNFQRGLVRHSFIEMNETYITSFGWVILGLLFLEIFKNKLSIGYWTLLMTAGFFSSIHTLEKNYSLIDREKSFSVNNLPTISGKKIDRSSENYDYGIYTKPVVNFLKNHLKGSETFFDFSNSPLLYYYTEKKIPAYFSQSLQYIVDLYLQNECIKTLQNEKVPYVVFNQTNQSFGDNVDGIPNKVRYHYISSYLIDNYIPSNEYGLFHVWKQKTKAEIDTIQHHVQTEYWELGLIPFYWKQNQNEPEFKFKRKVVVADKKAQLGKIQGGDFIQLKVKSVKDTELKMWLKGEKETLFYVKISIKAGVFKYKFPLCGSYHVRNEKNPLFEFEVDQDSKLLNIEIVNQSY